MNIPLTSIVMPVFNRRRETLAAIESVRRNTPREHHILTVVDNGSDADLRWDLLALHASGDIDNLLVLDRNYGVSCACNVGWMHVDAPFFVKLDNDMRVLSPTWLESVYGMWGRDRYSSIFGPGWRLARTQGRMESEHGTFWKLPISLSGQAFFVGARVRDRIGRFSEDYGLYGEEDADYCLRCHHAGIRKHTFEAAPLLENMGTDNSVYAEKDISKKELHDRNVGTEGSAGIFALNLFLYQNGLRPLNVPLKYEIDRRDGVFLTMREREEYAILHPKLQRCLEIYNRSSGSHVPEEDLREMREALS